MNVHWLVFLMAFALNFNQLVLSDRTVDGTEKRLFRKLFSNHSSSPRPTKSGNVPVYVKFGVSLNQILDLDEKKHMLSTSVWITESWSDDSLKWEISEYDELDTLVVPSTSLWNPDIFIFNTAGGDLGGFVNVTGGRVKIQSDGGVSWLIPLMIRSSCEVDATYFPYDEQTCSIYFGSWTYDESQVDLQPYSMKPDLSNYIDNNEFDLKSVSMARQLADEKCCPGSGSHPMVVMQIQIERKSIYYEYIVITPTILLSVLSMFTFCLPSHHGDKISIGLTVFLTLYVLQLLISDNVPDTNTTPMLGLFTFMVMTLNCTSLIIATLVMNIKTRGKLKPVPEVPVLLSHICRDYLAKIICNQSAKSLNEFAMCSNDSSNSSTNHYIGEEQLVETKNIPMEDIQRNNDECTLFETENVRLNTDVVPDLDNSLTYNSSSSPLIDPASFNHNDQLFLHILSHRRPSTLTLLNGLKHHAGQTKEENIQYNKSEKSDNDLDNVDERRQKDPLADLDAKQNQDLSEAQKQILLKREWTFVADTIDKASFILYIIVTMVTILTILVIVPKFK